LIFNHKAGHRTRWTEVSRYRKRYKSNSHSLGNRPQDFRNRRFLAQLTQSVSQLAPEMVCNQHWPRRESARSFGCFQGPSIGNGAGSFGRLATQFLPAAVRV